ncbi:MAG: hypothetical protein QM753_05885 [Thermomicrobiales bacterium]
MSRPHRPRRPSRSYRITVRTERRDPIDYAALARAALEQAAIDQMQEAAGAVSSSSTQQNTIEIEEDQLIDPDEGVPS